MSGTLDIGRTLRIVPAGQAPPVDHGRIDIVLEPGAFGSGEHETTAACLELIEGLGPRDMRILDLGTGTGVLAVAALRLGAAFAVGVDIDPRGAAVARRNAVRNGVGGRACFVAGELAAVGHARFDLVVANVYADVLDAVAPALVARSAPAATVLLSGIAWEAAFDVRNRYERLGCGTLDSRTGDEFCTFLLRAPG